MQRSLKHLSFLLLHITMFAVQPYVNPPTPMSAVLILLESIPITHTADPGKRDLVYSHWRVCINSQKALAGSLKCGGFLLPAVCTTRQLDPVSQGLSEPRMRTCSFIIPLQTVGLMTNRANEPLSAVWGLPSQDPTTVHKIQNHKNSDKPHRAPPPCGSTQTRPTISMMDFSPDTLFLKQPN